MQDFSSMPLENKPDDMLQMHQSVGRLQTTFTDAVNKNTKSVLYKFKHKFQVRLNT